MVAAFLKNGTIFVVSDKDLTPTTGVMRSLPSERAMFYLDGILATGARTTIDPTQRRKHRIKRRRRDCQIGQVRAFREWSVQNKHENEKRYSLVAEYYNYVDLDRALLKLGKTRHDEFDDEECAQLASMLRLADFEHDEPSTDFTDRHNG